MTRDDILRGLLARGVPYNAAVGAVAGMGAESGFDPGINEIAPVVPGSRGGYGLNQWTGPRRRQFEAFAAERGAPLDDLDTQLDFTVWELNNTETAARDALYAASSPDEAISIYETKFLRPGVPHGGRGSKSVEGVAPPQPGQPQYPGQQPDARNALAAEQTPNAFMLNPEAFMRQRNALAFAPITFERRNSLYGT